MEYTILEGELLFFSKHYQIALLEIEVDVQFQIEIPPFGSYPKYGHELFTLAREHKELSLMVRRGTISQLQEYLGLHHHLLFVEYELPACGAGGPVVDRSGDVVGMSYHHADGSSTILSISTVLSCVDMWTSSDVLLAPCLVCALRMWSLVISLLMRSTLILPLGILALEDNVIVSFNGQCPTPLPEFEDLLLSCGLAHLHGTHTEVDFKLEVHDPLQDIKRSITLRVPFTDVSKDLAED
uniref:Uncharacterized protein n=1 Tax=Arundo donax TaxID=35708 RepID=A0A0A9GVF8_ARUDO